MTLTATRSRACYPWQAWTDGAARYAKPGVDFWVSAKSFRNTLYRHATVNGLRCYSRTEPDGSVYFRFWEDPDA